MKRRPLPKGQSRRSFKNSSGVHPKNNPRPANMRGGIRL